MVGALRRTLPGQPVVLAQEGRQLQRLQVVREQDLRCVVNAERKFLRSAGRKFPG